MSLLVSVAALSYALGQGQGVTSCLMSENTLPARDSVCPWQLDSGRAIEKAKPWVQIAACR